MPTHVTSRHVYQQLKDNAPYLPDGTHVERVELILEPADIARIVITCYVTDELAEALTHYALTEVEPKPDQTPGG